MYDFPPHPSTLWANVIGALVVCAGTGVIFWMLRQKRELHVFDASIFIGIAIGQTYLLTQEYGLPPNARETSTFVFLVIVWLGSLTASIVHWIRHENSDQPQEWILRISYGCWLLTIFSAFVIFLLLPATSNFDRTWEPRRQCKLNFKQIGLALHNYHDTYETFPAAFAGKPRQSWRVNILPYIDQAPLYNEYDFNSKWNEGANDELSQNKLAVYRCPSDPYQPKEAKYPFTAYAAIIDPNSTWPGTEAIPVSKITDGSSNTIMVVEACGQRIPWAEPRDVSFDETPTGVNLSGSKLNHSDGIVSSYHTGGANVLLGDGSVRFLSENIDSKVVRNLITRNGGEAVGDF